MLAVPAAQAAPSRILALGDSITRGVSGQCSFRRDLSQSLFGRSECDVTFVGPRLEPEDNPSYCQATNTRHAGFPGWKANRFLDENLVTTYMNQYAPDYVLIHLGSNDINQGDGVSNAVDDIDRIIDQTFSARPGARVMLANVIPWDPRLADNPNVDELAETAALSAALNDLVSERAGRGEAVYLVDVANGFDSDAMTIDGIHPNDQGEAFMASRFLTSLNAAGICGTPAVEPPALQLKNNVWAQISLPANPGTSNTVADIFDELPMDTYNKSWVVFGTDTTVGSEFKYQRLALNSRLQVGTGYWVIQKTGASVTVRVPAGSLPVQTQSQTGCAPGTSCYASNLRSRPDGVLWNLTGFPYPKNSSLARTRFQTSGGGCANGCTLNEAQLNRVAGSALYHYDPTVSGDSPYRKITEASLIKPWEGVWIPVLPAAHQQSPRLLFAP